MKKASYFIHTKKGPCLVDGYTFTANGLNFGVSRAFAVDGTVKYGKIWVLTELSTGAKFFTFSKRKTGYETANAPKYADAIRAAVESPEGEKLRDEISAAYAASEISA